jgi:hypothetical protein
MISCHVTCNETWVHHFTLTSKTALNRGKHATSPVSRKFMSVQSVEVVVLTAFWDAEGIILLEFQD